MRERVHELRGGQAALLLRRLYSLSMQRVQRPLAFLDGLPRASRRRGGRREARVRLGRSEVRPSLKRPGDIAVEPRAEGGLLQRAAPGWG